MRGLMSVPIMFGVVWLGLGVVALIHVSSTYGSFSSDSYTEELHRDQGPHDVLIALLAAIMLWPILLCHFRNEYNYIKWLL